MTLSKTINLKKSTFFVISILLVFFTGLGALSVQYISTTYDEKIHYAYGEELLQGDSRRTGIHGDSNMPVTAWNALPERMGFFLSDGPIRSFLTNFQTARYMTLIFSAATALLIFHWSRSLYGTIPGFVSLILYIFDPNIIAHSQLVTTDIFAAGTTAFVFYCLWRFARNRTILNGIIFSLALGLSQLTKYTTIVLIPLSLLTILLYDMPSLYRSLHEPGKIKTFVARYIGYVTLAIIVVALIINMGFLFNRTFTNFGKYKFRSDWFQTLKNYPELRTIAVPFPYPYLDGIDWMRHTQVSGGNSGPVYLLGKLNKQGFQGYYFLASILKVPISTQILIIAASLLYFTQANRRKNFMRDEIFLFGVISFYTIYFNFFFNVQIGIRYYLLVFPLLYIFAGSFFREWNEFRIVQKLSSLALLAYLVISVLSFYPFYLTYFNEFVWNKTQSYKFLADSNLDWGQNSIQLSQYLTDHPDAVFEPNDIRAGHLIIGINDLVGVMDNPSKFAWVRNNFEPVGTIANSVLIYQISPDEINKPDFSK